MAIVNISDQYSVGGWSWWRAIELEKFAMSGEMWVDPSRLKIKAYFDKEEKSWCVSSNNSFRAFSSDLGTALVSYLKQSCSCLEETKTLLILKELLVDFCDIDEDKQLVIDFLGPKEGWSIMFDHE